MGYDLYSAKGKFHWTVYDWSNVLKLANEFGWQPAGTEAPPPVYDESGQIVYDSPSNWEGDYFSNDSQRVTDDDAKQLAIALEAALFHAPPERFEIIHKGKLNEFIDFCFSGGFEIR